MIIGKAHELPFELFSALSKPITPRWFILHFSPERLSSVLGLAASTPLPVNIVTDDTSIISHVECPTAARVLPLSAIEQTLDAGPAFSLYLPDVSQEYEEYMKGALIQGHVAVWLIPADTSSLVF